MTTNIEHLKTVSKTEPISAFLETRLLEISEGFARVAMKMKPDYLNFNGMVFGGIISAVADQAFAYATNSVITPNVATQFNIHFVAVAKDSDELFAECRVIKSGKRVCISEMTVTDQENRLIARATGTTIPLVKK